MKIARTLALWAAMAAGCAGFDRGALEERLAGQPVTVTDEEIAEALKLKPQLRFPIKVGVLLLADSYRPDPRRPPPPDEVWRWKVADREKLASLTDDLKARGIVSDIFVISESVVSGTDLRGARLAAAKHGADAVMVLRGISQVDSYNNPLWLLNVLIVPGWVLPGSHRDALLMLQGAMYDVGNGYLYLTVDAEGEGKTVRPTFRARNEEAIEKAKERALGEFGKEFAKRLRSLKGV